MLQGKHILLGITGSIAAYKAAILVRMLIRERAEVQVIMTPLAMEFITPLTLSTLSKKPVLTELFNPRTGDWNSHVDLGTWADLMVIAPATANTIGKMVTGIADNLLLTTYLSARCPVMLAPAMDLDMFRHPSTQANLITLSARGVQLIEPATGELASGLEGKGRMEEPEAIIKKIHAYFNQKESVKKKLSGKKILITAGPTFEPIDPVRFIGNHSSGKMGYALADAFARAGAEVLLISGPVSMSANHPGIRLVKVQTAAEMFDACTSNFKKMDIAIMAAAVADFTPEHKSPEKIKRKGNNLNLNLVPTPDIAAALGKLKKSGQVLVGFALETQNGIENAQGKLQRKNLDLIVLNSLEDEGAGFGGDTNKITLIDNKNTITGFELKSKTEVAQDILESICSLI
jgi:phosphopantothenoylcysteine decarboxylase/phosphopantothenate--cysteine ligase